MRSLFTTIIFFWGSLLYSFQPVDITVASAEQIALLPGVGMRLAENIVAARKHRAFSTANDLADIAGMTKRKLAGLTPHVVFTSRNKKGRVARALVVVEPEIMMPLSSAPVMDIAALEQRTLLWQGLEQRADDSRHKRVRVAAWLPQLSTYIDTDHGESLTRKAAGAPAQTRGGQDLGFGVKASFDLDKLIFNKDELDVAKLAMSRQDKRNEILAELRRHYFRFIEIQNTRVKHRDDEQRDKLKAELAQITATLDGLSGNAFSEFLRAEAS